VPKTKRDDLKRQAAHAMNNLDRATVHLFNVEQTFEGVHPELAEALKAAIVGIDTVKAVVENFVIAAWGKLPDDWQKWRATGEE